MTEKMQGILCGIGLLLTMIFFGIVDKGVIL